MNASEPSALATWLMSKLVASEKRESIIGDLMEQHRRGRSSAWFWRQTISAIVISMTAEIWDHRWLALSVAALSTFFSDIYMFSRLWVWGARLDRLWYPYLINSRWGWILVNPWAYRLQLYALTGRVIWCTLLASVTWIMTRLQSRNRSLIVSLFLVPQVVLCIPYLRFALTNWLQEPGNPMWFFNFLWFSIFAFIAAPSSILFSGLAGNVPRSEG